MADLVMDAYQQHPIRLRINSQDREFDVESGRPRSHHRRGAQVPELDASALDAGQPFTTGSVLA